MRDCRRLSSVPCFPICSILKIRKWQLLAKYQMGALCIRNCTHSFFSLLLLPNDVITLSYIGERHRRGQDYACRSNVHSARTACHSVYREIPLTVTSMLFGSHYSCGVTWHVSPVDGHKKTLEILQDRYDHLGGDLCFHRFDGTRYRPGDRNLLFNIHGRLTFSVAAELHAGTVWRNRYKIFRIQSPLFFANAAYLKKALALPSPLSKVVQPAEQDQTKEHSRNINNLHRYTSLESTVGHNSNDVMLNHVSANDSNHHSFESAIGDSNDRSDGCLLRTLIVDMSGVSFVDTVALNTLESIAQDYLAANAKVYLAECRSNVKHMLFTSGLVKSIDLEHIFLSVHDAVLHSQSMRATNQAKSLDPEHPLTIEEFEVADSAC
ncbi:putative pendrin isoform X2 [Apostichopus japonicus]|uniref:Putative pendrin isoform X2 n=1 Tax=Stichopus japonicus TaxID=307972 RepID=A0A2G8KUR5_STIJA|nr:putative pendrin isoform X2 [Apostichopus japonicus]